MNHGQVTQGQGIHSVVALAYADSAEMNGATGLTSADLGKVAQKLDDSTYWILATTTPTWVQLSTGSVATVPTWQSVINTDFAALPNQSPIYADGPMVLGGVTWALSQTWNDGTVFFGARVQNGVGLQYVFGRNTNSYLTNQGFPQVHSPRLDVSLSALSPLIKTTTPLRLRVRLGPPSTWVMPGDNVDGTLIALLQTNTNLTTASEYVWTKCQKRFWRASSGGSTVNQQVSTVSRRYSDTNLDETGAYRIANNTIGFDLPFGVVDKYTRAVGGDNADGTSLWVPEEEIGTYGVLASSSTETLLVSAIPSAFDINNWKLTLGTYANFNSASTYGLEQWQYTIRGIRLDAFI